MGKSSTIYPKVASAMAKMHKLVDLGPQVPREPCMWKKLHMFLEQYPPEKEFPDTKRLAENNISRQRLTAEVLMLEEKLKTSCKSPIVFTHNDLLLANIVINEKSSAGKVSFIDYEYGTTIIKNAILPTILMKWRGWKRWIFSPTILLKNSN